jgi:hypothetical protein
LTSDYSNCKATYPGFYSNGKSDPSHSNVVRDGTSPTEFLMRGYYSQLNMSNATTKETKIVQKACPAKSQLIMDGAVNELMGCRLWEAGKCSSTQSAYC